MTGISTQHTLNPRLSVDTENCYALQHCRLMEIVRGNDGIKATTSIFPWARDPHEGIGYIVVLPGRKFLAGLLESCHRHVLGDRIQYASLTRLPNFPQQLQTLLSTSARTQTFATSAPLLVRERRKSHQRSGRSRSPEFDVNSQLVLADTHKSEELSHEERPVRVGSLEIISMHDLYCVTFSYSSGQFVATC